MIALPKAKFSFGQNVVVHWHEVECGTTQAVITGVNLNRHKAVVYTITEENGQVTDEIDEDMITSVGEDLPLRKNIYFCMEMVDGEIQDRIGNLMGGRGKCSKCGGLVNNVAYHEAHDCKDGVGNEKVECPNCGCLVIDLAKHLDGCWPS